jgi:4-hydroxybenzoate polyprenyltransferase
MWLKPLFLMLVASTYVLRDLPDLQRLLSGFIIVGPLLWGGLYMLNAVTDVSDDARHPVKRLRPFPSGRVHPRLGAWVSGMLISLALLLGFQIGTLFTWCLVFMCAKQLAYTLPRLRLKQEFIWDIASGSIGNSTLRFAAGWFLFSNEWHLPLLLLFFAESLQLAGFLVNRLFTNYSTQLETGLHYRSTTTRLSAESIRRAIVVCWAVGICCFLLLALNSQLELAPQYLGQLPMESLAVLALLLVAVPFFSRAMQRADRFSYRESQLYYDLPLLYVFVLSIVLSFIIKVYS